METYKRWRRYRFSPYNAIEEATSYFCLAPVTLADISLSYPNTVLIVVIFSIANLAGFLLAILIDFRVHTMLMSLIKGLIYNGFVTILLLVHFSFTSFIFSTQLSSGELEFQYFYISLLSTVHFPITIFLSNLEKHNISYSLIMLANAIQGTISHYLMCRSVEEPVFNRRQIKFTLFSLIYHIAVFIVLGAYIFRP